jgi:hypothetical protein
VASSHPNYATVLLALVVVHLGLGVSGLLGSHRAPIWDYVGGDPGVAVEGVVHLLLAAGVTFGAYHSERIMRIAVLASVTFYLSLSALFGLAVLVPILEGHGMVNASEGFFHHVGWAMLAIAAFKEPSTPRCVRPPGLP